MRRPEKSKSGRRNRSRSDRRFVNWDESFKEFHTAREKAPNPAGRQRASQTLQEEIP